MTRTEVLVAFATALAGAAIIWPLLAMPAFLIVTLAIIVVDGRPRWVVAGLGGPLSAVAFVRFLLAYAIPNIIIAGQMAAEDKAVSHLREIHWAESTVREQSPRRYQLLSALLSSPPHVGATAQPPLSDKVFRSVEASQEIFRVDAYDVRVYLPAVGGGWTSDPARVDSAGAARAFIAYAWPVGERHGGERVFFIDQDEQICESSAARFRGPASAPPPAAAFSGVAGSNCGGSSAPDWHPWKKKKRSPKDRS